MAPSAPSSLPPWGIASSPLDMASSPAELTPRSKIRALMAQVSDDSDVDAPASPIRARAPLADAASKANRGPQPAGTTEKNHVLSRAHETGDRPKASTREHVSESTAVAQPQQEQNATNATSDAYSRIKAMVLNGDALAPAYRPTSRVEDNRDDSEAEDEEIVAPRGRMAARLQGGAAAATTGAPKAVTKEAEDVPAAEPVAEPTKDLSDSPASSQGDSSSSNPFRRGKFLLRKKAQQPESTTAEDPQSSQERADGDQAPDATDKDERAPSDTEASATNSRFLELVARKRQEREAKEAEEEKLREEKLARMREQLENEEQQQEAAVSAKKSKKSLQFSKAASPIERISDADDDADAEAEIDRKLTQQSRPTRKASKKALEEMSRETQRISRNMQLAHEARTRKKITTQSLLDRFNFRRGATTSAPNQAPADKSGPSSSTANSSAPSSDVEGAKEDHTPPTSPIRSPSSVKMATEQHAEQLAETLQNVQRINKADGGIISAADGFVTDAPNSKGKGKMVEEMLDGHQAADAAPAKQSIVPRPVKVHAVAAQIYTDGHDNSSDSDLEIMPKKKSTTLGVFERVQPTVKAGAEGKAMLTLRALAHLESPSKKSSSTAFTNQATLQMNLRKQARQQAARERAEKIQELRDRGIIIQTEEERERDQVQMEDILEKARRENEELARKEKDAARREAKANGEELPSSDEDDEEYEGDADDQAELDLSGSEDEEDDEDELAGEEEDADEDEQGEDDGIVRAENDGFILDAADEADESAEEADTEDSESEHQIPKQHQIRGQRTVIVDDEDEDENDAEIPNSLQRTSPPSSAPVNPFLQMATTSNSAPLALTQAFAATMADSQDDLPDPEPESMTEMPAPEFSMADLASSFLETQLPAGNTLDLDLHFSQSQVQEDSQLHTTQTATQADIPDPTQDAGFAMSSPARERFADPPPSTIATVRMDAESQPHSLTPQKRGRLMRRKQAVAAFSDEEDTAANVSDGDDDFDISADAFNVMKLAAIKANKQEEAFDKKKSRAKPMIEEQAEESEDEYAGLGGASDDESGGELDEETMRMIEHGEVEVDERTLAAFHANKERASDEKAVEKLFKDINNGGLRRKRRASLELTDSEDDLEDRRRRKRAEFARMRKALLADENVGKIAEDPKKSAFLHSIEDRDEADWANVLEVDNEEAPAASGSQDLSTQEIPESQVDTLSTQQAVLPEQRTAVTGSKRKRPLEESRSGPNKRLPAVMRRTRDVQRKPTTLTEMRESISFLTEDPHSMALIEVPSSDGEFEAEADDAVEVSGTASFATTTSSVSGFMAEARSGGSVFAARRVTATTVIDRVQVKRANSLNVTTDADGSRLAFFDPAAAGAPSGFKVPSLLRRAATADLNSGTDAHGISHGVPAAVATERAAGGADKGEFVRKSSGKKMSVNFQAREASRLVVVESVERRRVESVRKIAAVRKGVLGVLGGGAWE